MINNLPRTCCAFHGWRRCHQQKELRFEKCSITHSTGDSSVPRGFRSHGMLAAPVVAALKWLVQRDARFRLEVPKINSKWRHVDLCAKQTLKQRLADELAIVVFCHFWSIASRALNLSPLCQGLKISPTKISIMKWDTQLFLFDFAA